MPSRPVSIEILRAVAEALPEPIFVLDEDGRYVAIIGGAFRQKYDDPAALIGRSLHDVLPPARVAEFMGQVRLALDEDRTVLHDYQLGRDEVDDPETSGGPEGKQYFEGSVVPLGIVEGGRRLVAWIAYNATERHRLLRRLEEQQEQLEIQAMTDELTGLANRRRFWAALERDFEERGELALIVLDVDHFKRINDSLGHHVGDRVLQALGDLLRARTRRTDVAGRIGGEEFAVLLPDTDLGDAVRVAEEIRCSVRSTPVPVDGQGEVRFTVSAGVASVLAIDGDHSDLFRRADDALYSAKRAGRDRVGTRSAAGETAPEAGS